MCGRYVSTSGLEELAEVYGVADVRTDALEVRYNVAPTQPIYAVVTRRPSTDRAVAEAGRGKVPTRTLGALRWGLIPSWARDRSIASKLINARAEGIATKPAFRSALVRRRCVIPADSFYEWQAQPVGSDGPKRGRLPYAIRRRDGGLLSFAGLWEVWRDPADPDADLVRTATIVTTAANRALADIHPRMPVVLPDEAVGTWLDPSVEDIGTLTGLLVPAPDGWWESWAIGSRVNAVANEGPELLEPHPV